MRSYFVTHKLNSNITRSSNNFGPKQDPEKLIPNFILKIKNNEKVSLYGDGLNIRDWLYVKDNCEGIYLVLTKGAPGEIYNIGGGNELSNFSLTKLLLESMHKTTDLIEYVPDRLGHDRRYSVQYAKLNKLGFTPSTNFKENLIDTIGWFLKTYV